MSRQAFLLQKRYRPKLRKEKPQREKKLEKPFPITARTKMVKVYWGGWRHWFSMKVAAKAEATFILRSQCTCENYGREDGVGAGIYYKCRYHAMEPDHYYPLRDRIKEILLKSWRKNEAST